MSENVVTEALVNKKTGEVVEIGLQKSPDEIMLDARDAARALEKLIDSNKRKPPEFNGKRYLEFPHWQTISKFYHTTAATGETEYVELGGVKGFKAKAHCIDEKNGIIVGYAEAYCMSDEPNWKNKPLFQLASMAQTRAASKCLSNKYRYVAVVAGYEPTPSEEMDMSYERSLRPPQEKPKELQPIAAIAVEVPQTAAIGGEPLITEKQRKMLFARCREKAITDDDVKSFLWNTFELEHTTDLTRKNFDVVLKWVDEHK